MYHELPRLIERLEKQDEQCEKCLLRMLKMAGRTPTITLHLSSDGSFRLKRKCFPRMFGWSVLFLASQLKRDAIEKINDAGLEHLIPIISERDDGIFEEFL